MPLGIQLLNENKLPEMAQIMERLQKYVPMLPKEEPAEVSGKPLVLDKGSMLPVLLGGDQLTAARARGASAVRASHDRSYERLIPVVEDWHARLTFAKVSVHVLLCQLQYSVCMYWMCVGTYWKILGRVGQKVFLLGNVCIYL